MAASVEYGFKMNRTFTVSEKGFHNYVFGPVLKKNAFLNIIGKTLEIPKLSPQS